MKKKIMTLKIHVGINLCGGSTTLHADPKKHGAEMELYPEKPLPLGVLVKWQGKQKLVPFSNITDMEMVDVADESTGTDAGESQAGKPAKPTLVASDEPKSTPKAQATAAKAAKSK